MKIKCCVSLTNRSNRQLIYAAIYKFNQKDLSRALTHENTLSIIDEFLTFLGQNSQHASVCCTMYFFFTRECLMGFFIIHIPIKINNMENNADKDCE